MPDETDEPVLAEVAYAGTWRIERGESNESASLALHYLPSASNASGSIPLTKLGLTSEALSGAQHPLQFELRRDAGTFECRGSVGDGRGNGMFRFRPDTGYLNALAETGIPPLSLHQQIKAAMFDVSSSFVKAIVATGLTNVMFSELVALKIFRITAENVSALRAEFPSASLDDLRALAMTGVTGGYVETLRRANIGSLSADNVAALRASGIEQTFIEALVAQGHRGLSIDEVVSLFSSAS